MLSNISESTKLAGDGIAIVTWLSALVGALTGIVGLLGAIASLVWVCIRIFETRTIQRRFKQQEPCPHFHTCELRNK